MCAVLNELKGRISPHTKTGSSQIRTGNISYGQWKGAVNINTFLNITFLTIFFNEVS